MEYSIYRMVFQHGVHFGRTTLESSEMSFQADRLFSALCMEALSEGETTFSRLVAWAKNGELLLSDAFPYRGKEYFLPKPMARRDDLAQAGHSKMIDLKMRKKYKKLAYVPLRVFPHFMKKNFRLEELGNQVFGKYETKTSVFLGDGADAMPYRIGEFCFSQGLEGQGDCGLYVLAGTETREQKDLLDDLMDMLALSGIGGRRSSGLGRFEVYHADLPKEILACLRGEHSLYMTLSVALPKDEELEHAMTGARYLLSKRSGFIASERYADEFHRKKDIYAFQAGSCFKTRFQGQVADVSQKGGRHPVYRYLQPLFVGLDQ